MFWTLTYDNKEINSNNLWHLDFPYNYDRWKKLSSTNHKDSNVNWDPTIQRYQGKHQTYKATIPF